MSLELILIDYEKNILISNKKIHVTILSEFMGGYERI